VKRRIQVVAAVLGVMLSTGAVVTFARVKSQPPGPSPPRSLAISCPTPALRGTMPTLVYLPAGYHGRSRHYPVIYFLHGLPATPSSYTLNGFVAANVAADAREAIVVAPQGARTAGSDREYLNWGPNENWPRAIATDLTRCIDRRFQTIAGRAGRAPIGLSAGGFGAMNIGLRNLATFGAVESWSGYFEATDPSGRHKLDLGSSDANELARVPRMADLRTALTGRPTFIGFYVGRQDDRFLEDNVEFGRTLTAGHVIHLFRTYDGGHSAVLWRSEAPLWLDTALDALATLAAASRGASAPTASTAEAPAG
jgi:enterochelin esterase-like enzyme